MPSRLGQFAQSIIGRRMRRTDKGPATEQPSSTAPLIFESLEPRLLLAADPLGISAGYAFNEASGTTTADAYVLTLDQIQTDMVTPRAAPTHAITAPAGRETVSGTVTLPQAALDHMSEAAKAQLAELVPSLISALDHISETAKAQLAELVPWLISTDQSISSSTDNL